MSDTNPEHWAEQVTRDVYEFWKTKFPDWKAGIKTWYSPVRMNPELTIVGLNPGGGELHFKREGDKDRFERGDFSTPKVNQYLRPPDSHNPYPMTTKMQKFFEGREPILRDSVAFQMVFFRSSKYAELRQELGTESAKEIEIFCLRKVKEILDVLKPKTLLILGFRTFYTMQKHFGDFTDERDVAGKKRRIATECEWKGVPVFVLKHPTGARISASDWDIARRAYFH